VNRLQRAMRKVTGEIHFYALDENIAYRAQAWNGTRRDLECRAGPNVANNRMIANVPAARIAVGKVDTPPEAAAEWVGAWVARRNAASNDEFDLNFT
jgi:hypothetical protein